MLDENWVKIPPYAKIKIEWSDRPENYSRESKNKVRNHFARKYGVNKANIDVIYRPVKIDDKGNVIEISGAGIDNIMDVNYQRALMKEWYEREGKTVDFERLMKLDDKINGEIKIVNDELKFRSWNLKWLSINNFLCFGEDNYIPFSKYNGLNIVNSEPGNQGGKTTFSIDAPKFLFYGRTTKTDKNEQIFNTFSNNNELIVKGMVEYDGDKEVIIERKMTRSLKKDGTWAVKNYLNYYEILPDGEERLLNEEDAKITTLGIEQTIGSEKDFDITILATERNLDDLIDSTPTESGKLLTKFIGLEIVELKEKAVRDMYNSFSKTKQSNIYNIITLSDEISTSNDNIELYEALIIEQNENLEKLKVTLENLNNERDTLLESKHQIDVVISQLNPTKIQSDIDEILLKGTSFKTDVERLNSEIELIGAVEYNEEEYFEINKRLNEVNSKKIILESELRNIETTLNQLKNGEICPTCKRNLEDVDHSVEIKANEVLIEEKNSELNKINSTIDNFNKQITKINEIKVQVDYKNKLELIKDKTEAEMVSLRDEIKIKKIDLTKYKQNESSINHNIEVDIKVTVVKTNIIVKERERDELNKKITTVEFTLEENKKKIKINEAIIVKINKEEEIEKIFKVYIEMIGKKGISKLVLRSVLPIINSELSRLLDDICDFEVELLINSKNEVEYLLIKDEVTKLLKSGSGFERTVSSLALRCVLGKLSHLPMPNFITFDEVLGKVSNENMHKVKPMFERIKDMFDIVFLITHEDMVKDWSKNVITIVKENNISRIGTTVN